VRTDGPVYIRERRWWGLGGYGKVPFDNLLRRAISDGNSMLFIIADCRKRVLLSHLFDFVFGDFQVQRFKHSTHMSPKSKSKR
jgi:hypothetical protein